MQSGSNCRSADGDQAKGKAGCLFAECNSTKANAKTATGSSKIAIFVDFQRRVFGLIFDQNNFQSKNPIISGNRNGKLGVRVVATETRRIALWLGKAKTGWGLTKERNRFHFTSFDSILVLSEKQTSDDHHNSKVVLPSLKSPGRSTIMQIGTMRHDIPHRWKTQFITICSVNTFDSIFLFENRILVAMWSVFGGSSAFWTRLQMSRYTCLLFEFLEFRFTECALMIHSHCRHNISNSCGLPSACAGFYLNAYSLTNDAGNDDDDEAMLSGWVKLWRSDASSVKKWQNAWATIAHNKLDFYESDTATTAASAAFISIDLMTERWRIHNQVSAIDGVSPESMSMLVEIKLPT